MSEPRLLHTMIRVKDLDRSVDFYTRLLGMRELRRREVPEGKYTLSFVGYANEPEHAVVEVVTADPDEVDSRVPLVLYQLMAALTLTAADAERASNVAV